MSFDELVAELIASIKPVAGEYFREVELKYSHRDDVISGEGAFLYGNRFIRPGKHAVYASLTEETALQEYKYGQQKAYGKLLREISVHATYTIVIEVERCADLRSVNNFRFATSLMEILKPNEHAASQALGDRLLADGIQALIYPSAIPSHDGTNIVCVLETDPPPHVQVKDRDKILLELQRIGCKVRIP